MMPRAHSSRAGYGWEWATCEVGFLIVFLTTEWPSRSSFPRALPPPTIILLLLRWYVFRLLLGAGQSKLGERSSACWRQLSCTDTHYFTQPMPNPLAWLFHRLPTVFHRFEVALTFIEQLALPFLVLMPFRSLRIFACVAEMTLQLGIVGTGNCAPLPPPTHGTRKRIVAEPHCALTRGGFDSRRMGADAWINWIGMLPSIALLDDDFIAHHLALVLPRGMIAEARQAQAEVAGSGAAAASKRDYAKLATHEIEAALVEEDESTSTDAERDVGSGRGTDGGAGRQGGGGVARKPGGRGVASSSSSSSCSRTSRAGRVILRAYSQWRLLLHLLLAGFVACKSAAPLKELFTPAPWLQYYDEYFFVNAQVGAAPKFGLPPHFSSHAFSAHAPSRLLPCSYSQPPPPPLPSPP